MSRRAARATHDGKQAARKEPLHSPIFKGIEFDAFKKSAPLTRHAGRGVMAISGRDGKPQGGVPSNRRERAWGD